MLQRPLPSILIPVLWITGLATGNIIQEPQKLIAIHGQNVTLLCIIELEDNYVVTWSRTPGLAQEHGRRREITLPDLTHKFQRDQDSTSLVISAVEVEDSGWYYCRFRTLAKEGDQEGNGTQLIVQVPPSVPVVLLQVPPAQASERWNLLCLTGGFTPANFSLRWTRMLVGSLIEPTGPDCPWNTTEPEVNRSDNVTTLSREQDAPWYPWQRHGHCLRLTVSSGQQFRQLVSVLELPPQASQSDDVIYTCSVSGHPALTSALTASFKWEARGNMMIGHLNVLKIAVLCGLVLFLTVSGLRCMCIKKDK